MDLIASQVADVQRRYPGACVEQAADGQRVLLVPEVPAGAGWNPPVATLRIVIPAGYPHVRPDCFYTDENLRLASGAEPANSSIQPVFGGQYRWFSWHLSAWDEGNGSLDQYVRFCERRLREAR